jgi:ElaB/YqjD/DUF883 family membrane-anchored ribosome-binding protein
MKYQDYITNGTARGRRPAEIDSDLSAIRSEMSETLHLLEDRFSPRAVLEQLFSGARSGVRGAGQGSSEFVGNLGATIRDNPVPVLLLTSGVVSLLAADRSGAGRRARRVPLHGETIADDISEIRRAVEGETGSASVKERAHEVAGNVNERAHDLRDRVSERATELGERASELRAHAQESRAAARERVRGAVQHTRERGSRTLQEEPLVIVGLGLAIGAVLGAGMPVSERERRMLGHEGGERLVRRGESAIGRARHAVQEGVERAADVATQRAPAQRSEPIAPAPTPAPASASTPAPAPREETPIVLGASESVVVDLPRVITDTDPTDDR